MPKPAISLDIETYGAHKALPEQTVFSPGRFLYVDGATTPILTCSITTILDPLASSPWSALRLSKLRPDRTFVLALGPLPPPTTPYPPWFNPDHTRSIPLLLRWIQSCGAILGMNLGFDLAVLCHYHPLLATILHESYPLLIDLSTVNFTENPDRPERSLKAIGPIIGTHVYDKTARDRFDDSAAIPVYNGEDTHNTVLAIAELARRITTRPEPLPSVQLSELALTYFSDTIYATIEMTNAGVPISRSALLALHQRLLRRIHRASTVALRKYSLPLQGTGSDKAGYAFMTALVTAVDDHYFSGPHCPPLPIPGHPSHSSTILDHPRLTLTDKTRKVSFSDANRTFLSALLPPTHPLRRVCRVIELFATADKLHSSFTQPYLFHKSKEPASRKSVFVPLRPVAPCECPKCLEAQSLTNLAQSLSSKSSQVSPKRRSRATAKANRSPTSSTTTTPDTNATSNPSPIPETSTEPPSQPTSKPTTPSTTDAPLTVSDLPCPF